MRVIDLLTGIDFKIVKEFMDNEFTGYRELERKGLYFHYLKSRLPKLEKVGILTAKPKKWLAGRNKKEVVRGKMYKINNNNEIVKILRRGI